MQAISITELQEYYPLTNSLTQEKINILTNSVKNTIFLQMFGLSISNKIFDGSILNNETDNFIGFRKFVALCVACQLVEDSFIHTNAGLKVINQQNWGSPKVNEKSNALNKISQTVENQLVEAKKILTNLGFTSEDNFKSFGTFEIKRV